MYLPTKTLKYLSLLLIFRLIHNNQTCRLKGALMNEVGVIPPSSAAGPQTIFDNNIFH